MDKNWPLKRIGLNVKNLARSVEFYERLGFNLIESNSKEAKLGVGSTEILNLRLLENATERPFSSAGLYHFAILLPSEEELGSFLNHLIKKRFAIEGASDHLVSQAIYLQDTEDNGIEIYSDRPSGQWSWDGDSIVMGGKGLDIQALLSKSKPFEKFSEGTKLGHVHLNVSDLNVSEDFYKSLNLQTVASMPTAKFMSWDKYHHHFGLNVWRGEGVSKVEPDTYGINFAELQKDGISGKKTDPNGIELRFS